MGFMEYSNMQAANLFEDEQNVKYTHGRSHLNLA